MSNRTVKIGLVPDGPTRSRIGVLIRRGKDTGTVIAPDEARTIADQIEDEDPRAAASLRKVAQSVEDAIRHYQGPGGLVAIAPKITGPEALRDWVARHRDLFRSGYREALKANWPLDTVLWAMPRTESLDESPVGFGLCRWADARRRLAKVKIAGSLDDSPPLTHFCVIASREEGRFQGTFVGWLPKPSFEERLPPAAVIQPPGETERN